MISEASFGERQRLVAELHRSLGNDFVQQVLRQVPDEQAAAEMKPTKAAAPTLDASTPVPSFVKDQLDASALTPRGPTTPADQHADQIQRISSIYDGVHSAATTILGSLAPAYQRARDQRDFAAVAELGGRIIAGFSIVHGGKSAFDELRPKQNYSSVQGTDATEDLKQAQVQADVAAKATLFNSLIPAVDAICANTLTPHVFQGQEVTGHAVITDLTKVNPAEGLAKLSGELQRTLAMLVLVDDLRSTLFRGGTLDKSKLNDARLRILPWATRPLDLAFLRAALGPIWNLLDSTATEPMDPKLGHVLEDSEKQAKQSGWLSDTGRFHIDNAVAHLHVGGRDMAELVIGDLYTTDPNTRADALMQIKQRGLLDTLCSAVGWADIKKLHDSLGGGHAEIKSDLQKYFIGDRKYGPSLGSEFENHDYSMHGLVSRLGPLGTALNFALDLGTFGFNSSYGKAIDDNSEGLTSDSEASRAKMHAAAKTAAIAAVTVLTGGVGEKAVRGSGAVSTARAIGAGATGGGAAGVTAVGASDVYDNYVSGDRDSFSSPTEYVKALFIGGVGGGLLGSLGKGLSKQSEAYLSKGTAGELPAASEIPGESTTSKPIAERTPSTAEPAAAQGEAQPAAAPRTRELGLREETVEAIEHFESLKEDPIGTINSKPNKNHYNAARREAEGEVVARRVDGRPFDHIRDLQENYNGLENVRERFEFEMEHPTPEMTERGLDVLLNKYKELQSTMSRLKGFLDSIGHGPPYPPFHEWPPGS